MLVSSVLGMQLPVWSSSFNFWTLLVGSSSFRESERPESPMKYVPSPAMVPEASAIRVSVGGSVVPQKKNRVGIILRTVRDALDLSGRSVVPIQGIWNGDIVARGVHFDHAALIGRVGFASVP